jgi:uncharacterized protein (TIGR00369 family)
MRNKTEKGISPFWDYIGIEEVFLEDGKAELRMEVTPQLLQRKGAVHGGAICSLLDASIGSAVRSTLEEGQHTATIEIKINFIRPAKAEVLIAKSYLVHRGKTTAVGQSEIFDQNGTLVAMATGTFMIPKDDRGGSKDA